MLPNRTLHPSVLWSSLTFTAALVQRRAALCRVGFHLGRIEASGLRRGRAKVTPKDSDGAWGPLKEGSGEGNRCIYSQEVGIASRCCSVAAWAARPTSCWGSIGRAEFGSKEEPLIYFLTTDVTPPTCLLGAASCS